MLLAQRSAFRHGRAVRTLMGSRIQEHSFNDFPADTHIGIPASARRACKADSLNAFAVVRRTLDDNPAITTTAA
jgi:hypothetical protein